MIKNSMRFISLRIKILRLVIPMIVVLGILFIFVVLNVFQKQIKREVEARSKFISRKIADDAIGYIVKDNIIGLTSYLDGVISLDKELAQPNLAYIFILDKSGNIIAHTFGDTFPIELKDANKTGSNKRENWVLLETEKGLVLDIAVPVQNGVLGYVRLGVSEQYVVNVINHAMLLMAGIIILSVISVSVLVLFFVNNWFKPIGELTKGVGIIGAGDLLYKVGVKSNDEVGQLASAFDKMTENLYKTTVSLDELLFERSVRKQAETRFSDLVNSLNAGVFLNIVGEDGTFADVNPAMIKICEADSREELLKFGINTLCVDRLKYMVLIGKLAKEGSVKDEEIELSSLKGRRFWAKITAVQRRNDNGKTFFEGTLEDITERREAVDKLRRNYDIQAVLNRLLSVSLKVASLDELLEYALNEVLDISWLSLESKGGVFLIEDDPHTLVLKVQRNLAVPLQTMCKFVALGRCLCGRAAQTGELVFSDHVDERHENVYTNMPSHGHYCVPLVLTGGNVMGVLNLYIKSEYHRDPKEESFLMTLANVIAMIIQRKKMEDKLLDKVEEIDKLNHFMVGRERRIIELKKEVDDILKDAGRPPRYNIV
ncbi:MAG: GAF domain-containing protein [Candidatus Omnitrophica bacterium]|nr:GAF domain-containing protein [Candidatus Omnitrophota bacterium]